MDYLIGDVQGCCDALDRLLAEIDFSPSRDHLALVGDLVNRGPGSLATLKRLRAMGDAATCLLGNHDLHLLAVAHGVRKPRKDDTLDDILGSKKRDAWLDWVRHRRMAHVVDGWLLVHAGVVPQWDAATTLALAGEVEAVLRGRDLPDMLQQMYGNEPAQWSDALHGAERWRFIVNVLTRIRFCTPEGRLELNSKEGAAAAPPGCQPWFDIAGRAHRRHADGLRPLVHAGPHRPARPVGAGHRLRVGRPAQRSARGRRPARMGAGGLQTGAGAGLMAPGKQRQAMPPVGACILLRKTHRSAPARRAASAVLALALCLSTGGCAWLDRKQRELALRPTPTQASDSAALRPGDQRYTVDVLSADGEAQRLALWWLPHDDARAPALLYLHGTFRNLYRNLPKIEALREAGFAVLAVDYRGWGDSTPIVPSEASIVADAWVAWAELARRQPDCRPARDLRPLDGRRGRGDAGQPVARRQPTTARWCSNRASARMPEVAAAAGFWGGVGAAVTTLQFDAVSKIGRVDAPVLMLHGTADRTVPWSWAAACAMPRRRA